MFLLAVGQVLRVFGRAPLLLLFLVGAGPQLDAAGHEEGDQDGSPPTT